MSHKNGEAIQRVEHLYSSLVEARLNGSAEHSESSNKVLSVS
jgi:hypothetical protein